MEHEARASIEGGGGVVIKFRYLLSFVAGEGTVPCPFDVPYL